MGKLFGTDGIRGVVGEHLDCELAFRVGLAVAAIFDRQHARRRPLFLIGKDTRASSDMLEAALAAGLCSAGADVILLGVAPTPAVAHLVVTRRADAGVVISASHNTFEHNGIKIFNHKGFKLSDEQEEEIEALLLSPDPLPRKSGDAVGRIRFDPDLVEQYIAHLADSIPDDLTGLRIAVDCANGAASRTAARLFSQLGADCDVCFDRPNGMNINDGCGSTHLGALSARVCAGGYDCGVAFDGDADRCLFIDEQGREVDGDRIMAVCALEEKRQGTLAGDTIVATVMSNLGFRTFCRENDLIVETAQVGDRYVLQRMLEGGFSLGGEQSGHVIFLRHATTGDGQLTAVQFLHILKQNGGSISEMTGCIPTFPQVLKSLTVSPSFKQTYAEHPLVNAAMCEAEAALGEDGRLLVRPSGTELLVRVMAEGRDEAQVRALVDRVVDALRDADVE